MCIYIIHTGYVYMKLHIRVFAVDQQEERAEVESCTVSRSIQGHEKRTSILEQH